QALPELSAVMSRWPWPSRWTLLAEPVIVSTSPVPQLAAPLAEVVPVRVIQLAEDGAEPADPAKLSPHTGVQPGAGDVQGLRPAGARGRGVDRSPRRVVVGDLDLEGGRVGVFPLQHHLADR